jgi:hypothetical protein
MRIKEEWQKPYKGALTYRVSICKLIHLQQGADSNSQPGEAEKTSAGRGSPVVRNLPKGFSDTDLHLKADHSQKGASSSGIPPWGAESISQPREPEKTTRGRGSLIVRNLHLLYI